jgi:dihydroflavonol-4-reductase
MTVPLGWPVRRALVLGATGHLGQAIVRELLDRGVQVTAASRQVRPPALAGLDLTPVSGDADRGDQLTLWASGHDLIVDAAAPYPTNLFAPTNDAERDPLGYARRRTRALLDATAASGARLAFVSSFTTLPRHDEGVQRLEAQLRRTLHPYFAVKQVMEEMILEAARGGLPALVVNPTACFGPWDRKPRALCAIPQLVAGEVPATVGHVVNVIDVRDVARMLVRMLERGQTGGPHLLSAHDTTVDALARRTCAIAGVLPPLLSAPTRVAAAMALYVEAAWAFWGRPSPVPALGMLLLLDGQASPASPAGQTLDVTPRPLDETVHDAISWYRSIGYC